MSLIVITIAPLLLLCISAVVCDDVSCLNGLKASMESGAGKLNEWTPLLLAKPCDTPTSSKLNGIGCNGNRVISIVLNFFDLSGTLPPTIAGCTNLQTLDLSSNHLSGPLPSNIGNLTYLVSFNLSSNLFSGPIPVEISACSYLNFLDLHLNQLYGSIPGQIGLLQRLKYFDVSHNKLSGQIPGSLSNTSTGSPRFNASSFVGNKGLYGYPLPPSSSHSLSVLAIVGIGLGSGLLSLIVSFTAVCIWLRVSEQGFAAQEGKISQLVSES